MSIKSYLQLPKTWCVSDQTFANPEIALDGEAGTNPTFPKTAEPAKTLADKEWGVQVVQAERSKLSSEALKIGFDKMDANKRRKWLDDI